MYIITWTDRRTHEERTIRCSTARAMREITSTLQRNPQQADNVRATYRAPSRLRELVIIFEQ